MRKYIAVALFVVLQSATPVHAGPRQAGGQGGSVISSVTVTVIINNAAPNVDPHWIWCYGKDGAAPTHEYTERCP